ncbi:hypothetical protein QTI31_03925 [Clostridium perfringens]|uniref:hypothetical protein n=1 Tax=Clostridium perfringens TaxID=1502 RepID=UPI00374F4CBA|nr:hypothetical protein [Clostridium perfringens]
MSIGNILEELTQIDVVDNEDYDSQILKICSKITHFLKGNKRLIYSDITTFSLNMNDEDREYLYYNLDRVIQHIEELEIKNKVIKIKDHITLEELRMDYFKKTRVNEIEKALNNSQIKNKDIIENYNGILQGLKKTEDELENQKKSVEGLNSQIISVIGIFSAIVITFFGGAELFSNALNTMNEVSKYRLLVVVLLISIVMFNTIFMLLNFISKLTEKEIASKACLGHRYDSEKCSNCSIRDKAFKCIKRKYPIVFVFNLIAIILLGIIATIYIIDNYNTVTKLILHLISKLQ